jgi:PHS family inorganic phosphate transporter-like MFS transporter
MFNSENSVRPFTAIDSKPLSRAHLRIWFTAGMGFFTDAYDLFIIGVALLIFGAYNIPGFTLHSTILGQAVAGFIGSSAIFAAVFGQLLFGFLGDRIGRKTVYGIEAGILAAGAILSALSPSVLYLILFRFIQGIGIGGDYPISATIMSEYSNVKDRGKLISLIFANQGIGSVAAVLVGLGSVALLPPDLAWRVALGAGAIPALVVIYFRRKIPETPRYSLLVKGNVEEARRGASVLESGLTATNVRSKESNFSNFLHRYWKTLIVTAGSWFLLDVAFYGTGIYSGAIVSSIIPVSSSLPVSSQLFNKILESGVPFFVGFFGYFTAVALLDRLGRKITQLQGFIAMALLYAAVSYFAMTKGTSITGFLIPSSFALALYALTFFFIDFGPNTTTFVVPAEVYPTKHRTTGHGISAAAGKLGAALTTFYFPALLLNIGVKGILEMLAVVSIVGALLTLGLKEPNKLTLEQVAREELVNEKEVKAIN